MKKISNEKYDELMTYERDKMNGRVLTPSGLELIVKACNFNPQLIGETMLESYWKMKRK